MGASAGESDQTNGASKGGNGPVTGKSGWDFALPVLSAIATGIGAIGFVTFFGGAVVWTRADAAHLPAFETVALLPTSVLITTGAHFLVAALLIAVLAVAVLYLYRVAIDIPLEQKVESQSEAVSNQLQTVRSTSNRAGATVAHAQEEQRTAQADRRKLQDELEAAENQHTSTDQIKAELAKAQGRVDAAVAQNQDATQEQERLSQEIEELSKQAKQSKSEADKKLRQRRLVTAAISGVALVVLELAIMGFSSIPPLAYLSLILISLITAGLTVAVYAERQQFSWFGVAAFLSVSLFIGASTYFRTRYHPTAEPAAALVGSTKAVAGYFVAQTSDRVYFGEPPRSGLPGRVVALNRDQLTALSVGPLTTIKQSKAITVAHAMALAICRQVPTPTTTVKTRAPRATTRTITKTVKGACPSPSGVSPLY